MKRNPKMKVMLMGGYFDLGTLFFGSEYEMKHLPMPKSLQSNISYHFFPTGHMVYVNEDGLKGMHAICFGADPGDRGRTLGNTDWQA